MTIEKPLGPFTYIRVDDPNSIKAQTMGVVRERYYSIFEMIDDLVPEGRYKSLAKTALEESSLWAQRGLALEYEETEE